LIKSILGKVYIPQAVYDEVVENGAGLSGAEEIRSADFIIVLQVQNKMAVSLLKGHLDLGETEVIVLAKENDVRAVLIDDRKARKYAQAAEIKVLGTLFLLHIGLKRGLIIDSYEELVSKLKKAGMHVADHILECLFEQKSYE
jgi:predicted nucleic acid-binding protein